MKAKTAKQTITGADVVVRMLEARGTKYVFGVPGAKIDKVFSACNKTSGCTILASGSLCSEELLWPLSLFRMRYGV